MIAVQPIAVEHLAEVGRFLHENLNGKISPEAWSGSLTHRWAESQPNYGMQLRDNDRLVGVFCAIYSDQWIDGRLEKFCNPHSWCVLDEYRNHGIGLVLRLLKQSGYHFTMFTPNPKVAKVFLGLRFTKLDDSALYIPNLPIRSLLLPGAFVSSDPASIAGHLQGRERNDFEAHRAIPWLRFSAFGVRRRICLVVYKPDRFKRMPCASILHVSDPALLARHGSLLRSHLLLTEGYAFTRVEQRLLDGHFIFGLRTGPGQLKLAQTTGLDNNRISNLYSELVALDI
jgi:hypothetical protein